MIALRAVLLSLVSTGASSAADLPRLTGMVNAPGRHVALFDTGGGVPMPVVEGDEILGYHVRSISSDGVRLERDGQVALLRTSPAHAPVAPVDTGGPTFGLVLRNQPPPDD